MKVIFRCDPNLVAVLPRPQPARACLPNWLRQMPARAFSELHGSDIRTVKQCPPFIDAMTYGFMILLPCDVRVKNGAFSWNWDIPVPAAQQHPRAPLSFHVPEQLSGFLSGDSIAGEHSAIKFNSFWTIEIEDGWSIFATHPANREDLPFRTLTGMVDCDRFFDAGINFPAIWTKPNFDGVLPKGLPVAQCFPVRRDPFELSYESFDETHVEKYNSTVGEVLAGPGVYRKKFRDKRFRLRAKEGPQAILINEHESD